MSDKRNKRGEYDIDPWNNRPGDPAAGDVAFSGETARTIPDNEGGYDAPGSQPGGSSQYEPPVYEPRSGSPSPRPAPSSRGGFVPLTNPLKEAIDRGEVTLEDLPPSRYDGGDYLPDSEFGGEYAPDGAYAAPAYAAQPARAPAKPQKEQKPFLGRLSKGDSQFVFVISLINTILYAVWTVIYCACIAYREYAMDQAIAQMLAAGQTSFTVEVSSPLFIFLKLLLYLLPVFIIAWTVGILVAGNKKKRLCDRKIIIVAYIVDLIAGAAALADVFFIRLMFG